LNFLNFEHLNLFRISRFTDLRRVSFFG